MHKLSLALLISIGLCLPALDQTLAQKKEEPKKDAGKVAIPTKTFFKGQTATQFLARGQLIGVNVTDKDGQAIGVVDDLIIGTGNRIDGIVMGVGGFLGVGEKKIGVQIDALRITQSDGKLTVSLPNATREMLGTVEAYQRGGAAKK